MRRGINFILKGYQEMAKKILGLFSKKSENEDNKHIKKEILEKIVDIARKDHGNILVFLSRDSYENYAHDVTVLSDYIDEHMQDLPFKQGKNRMDTSSSTLLTNIQHDLDCVEKEGRVKRVILSVFTKSQAELDDLSNKCASLKDVSIYIV